MLTEQEKDIAYSQGLLEGVLKNAPDAVKTALELIVSGIALYREKYDKLKEDYDQLQTNYNNLIGLSAGYLQSIQEHRAHIDQLLIEQQRDFHHQE
jgi:hypothetical protein